MYSMNPVANRIQITASKTFRWHLKISIIFNFTSRHWALRSTKNLSMISQLEGVKIHIIVLFTSNLHMVFWLDTVFFVYSSWCSVYKSYMVQIHCSDTLKIEVKFWRTWNTWRAKVPFMLGTWLYRCYVVTTPETQSRMWAGKPDSTIQSNSEVCTFLESFHQSGPFSPLAEGVLYRIEPLSFFRFHSVPFLPVHFLFFVTSIYINVSFSGTAPLPRSLKPSWRRITANQPKNMASRPAWASTSTPVMKSSPR